jgi:enterochelin esterase-like enzyme
MVLRVTLLVSLTGCAATPLRLEYGHLPSPAMQGRSMEYGVYTPPGWQPAETLPLVVFLHGGGGDDVRCLDEAGIPALLDREIGAGRAPRAVIVVPEGDRGFWINWHDGSRRYEDWVLGELLPVIERKFNTASCPDGCHIAGISMGGNGALRWAMNHPETFSSVEILSGPIFDAAGMKAITHSFPFGWLVPVERIFGPPTEAGLRRVDPYQRWRSATDLGSIRLFVARGTEDRTGIIQTNETFRIHLELHGIPHRYVVFPGGHRWADWKPLFPELLRFAVQPKRAVTTGQTAVIDS